MTAGSECAVSIRHHQPCAWRPRSGCSGVTKPLWRQSRDGEAGVSLCSARHRCGRCACVKSRWAGGPQGHVGDTTVTVVYMEAIRPVHCRMFSGEGSGKTVMVAIPAERSRARSAATVALGRIHCIPEKSRRRLRMPALPSFFQSQRIRQRLCKARLAGLKREVGEENPFIMGADSVSATTVMTECARLEAARREKAGTTLRRPAARTNTRANASW